MSEPRIRDLVLVVECKSEHSAEAFLARFTHVTKSNNLYRPNTNFIPAVFGEMIIKHIGRFVHLRTFVHYEFTGPSASRVIDAACTRFGQYGHVYVTTDDQLDTDVPEFEFGKQIADLIDKTVALYRGDFHGSRLRLSVKDKRSEPVHF